MFLEEDGMLIEFRFKNYRSFRDEAVLSMEATGLGMYKSCLIKHKSKTYLLPGVAIYGKNGGGKSNVIRAFWLAVQFIKNAQRTQHADAAVPVRPFRLNDYSQKEPTEFEFIYTINGIKYWYLFSANSKQIYKEYLYHAPKGQKALVFYREGQKFSFTEDKSKRNLIAETVANNQLYFSVASIMNDHVCVQAMKWFREKVYFSRDYSDIPKQLLEYSNDPDMLNAISNYAKAADVGIEDMEFEINSKEIKGVSLPDEVPEGIKAALTEFLQALSQAADNAESKLSMNEVKAISMHIGLNESGESQLYPLALEDESDGTRKIMSLAPAIEKVLKSGGILLVDEIEKGLHPLLVNFIIAKFQSKDTNPKGAQLICTTHEIELMNMELLRKDQIYFVDKSQDTGSSELYSISEFGTKTADNIRKGYLLGKYGAIPELDIEEVN